MNELEEPIDMIPREAIYHMHVGDRRIIFWRDFDAFFRELLALFPSQRVELKRFYDTLFQALPRHHPPDRLGVRPPK